MEWDLKSVLLGLAFLVVLVGVALLNHRALDWVLSLVDYFQTHSVEACAVYVCVYIGVSMVGLPLTPLEIFTGFCFGFELGICLDMAGRVTGAALSFIIARYLIAKICADCVLCKSVKGAAALRGVGKAVEERGLPFLLLFNLAYVPVAVKNYGLGFVPEVDMVKFVLAIFIVEIPMASIWCFIGNSVAEDLSQVEGTHGNSTAVGAAINNAGTSENVYVKIGLLVVGGGSILLVLKTIHHFVSEELAKINAEDYTEVAQKEGSQEST